MTEQIPLSRIDRAARVIGASRWRKAAEKQLAVEL